LQGQRSWDDMHSINVFVPNKYGEDLRFTNKKGFNFPYQVSYQGDSKVYRLYLDKLKRKNLHLTMSSRDIEDVKISVSRKLRGGAFIFDILSFTIPIIGFAPLIIDFCTHNIYEVKNSNITTFPEEKNTNIITFREEDNYKEKTAHIAKDNSKNVENSIAHKRTTDLPLLIIEEGSVHFTDSDGNKLLNANENSTISFIVQNIGKGPGIGLNAKVETSGSAGISIGSVNVEPIGKGKKVTITIPIKASKALETGKATVTIIITEPNGLDCDPVEIEFPTLAFQPPHIEIMDGKFSTEGGGILEKKIATTLGLLVQNTGQGMAKNVKVILSQPDGVVPLSENIFEFSSLGPGDSREINYEFIVTNPYSSEQVVINTKTSESYGSYGSQRNFKISLNQTISKTRVSVGGEYKEIKIDRVSLTSAVTGMPPSYSFVML